MHIYVYVYLYIFWNHLGGDFGTLYIPFLSLSWLPAWQSHPRLIPEGFGPSNSPTWTGGHSLLWILYAVHETTERYPVWSALQNFSSLPALHINNPPTFCFPVRTSPQPAQHDFLLCHLIQRQEESSKYPGDSLNFQSNGLAFCVPCWNRFPLWT